MGRGLFHVLERDRVTTYMPTVTIRYTLPEEQGDYDAARLGRQMVSTIWEIDQHLRSICKHGEPTTAERHLAEAVRAMIRNGCPNALDL